MYYQLKKPIKKKKYNKLVDFLIENSDSFLFNLPNMGKTVVNERNADVMDEPIGYVDEEDQDEYMAYVESTKPCIDIIRDDIIESYFDTGCLDQITSIEHQIFLPKSAIKQSRFLCRRIAFQNGCSRTCLKIRALSKTEDVFFSVFPTKNYFLLILMFQRLKNF